MQIKVHLLNYHRANSHIELVLENLSTNPRTYYHINRFDTPNDAFSKTCTTLKHGFKSRIERADSTFTFIIDEDPTEIVRRWKEYHHACETDFLMGTSNNCADIVEWFLHEFAQVPKFSAFQQGLSQPLKFNHFVFGIQIPACLPMISSIPGRVMDNAKRYIPEGIASKPSNVCQFFQKVSGATGLVVASTALASHIIKSSQ